MELFDYDGAGSGPSMATAPARLSWSLSEEQWEAVRRYGAERRYPAGARILTQGDAVDSLHLVLAGTVALFGRGGGEPEEPLFQMQTGDAFGVAAFLDGGPAAVGAVAVSAATLLLLPRAGLEQLASWTPLVALALLRDLALFASQRLRQVGAAL